MVHFRSKHPLVSYNEALVLKGKAYARDGDPWSLPEEVIKAELSYLLRLQGGVGSSSSSSKPASTNPEQEYLQSLYMSEKVKFTCSA